MITKIEKITPQSLAEAKKIIVAGGVVAIPTETVYGLGGNAFDDGAVKRIFEIKGRPNDNPLIAHVHKDYDLSRIIDRDPPYAAKAARRLPSWAFDFGVSIHGESKSFRILRAGYARGKNSLARGRAGVFAGNRRPRRGAQRQPFQTRQPYDGAACVRRF